MCYPIYIIITQNKGPIGAWIYCGRTGYLSSSIEFRVSEYFLCSVHFKSIVIIIRSTVGICEYIYL